MANAFMASLSTGSAKDLGPPSGGKEALKYAAQADMFQDDPNFYAWLEEWIGRGDDESIMIDAFNTLTDYGMQYEFQQQQQQLESSKSGATNMDTVLAGGNGLNAETDLPQELHQAHLGSIRVAASRHHSVASHYISQPGEHTSLWGLGSPPDSSVGNSIASLSSTAMPPYSFSSCPAAPDAATVVVSSVVPGVRPNGRAAFISAASDAGPFNTESLIAPLTRGLDTYHVPAELSCLLGNSTDPTGSTSPQLPEGCIPSHGTITSYAGTPPSTAQKSVHNPAFPAAGSAVVGTTATVTRSGGGLRPELPNVPSLEQLIARAICGNSVGAVDGGRAAIPTAAAPSGGAAGGLSSLGMAVLGAGGFGHLSSANGSSIAGAASASTPTSCFVRDSSGSFGGGAPNSAVCSMDKDSLSDSGRLTSLGLPTQHWSSMRSMLTISAGGPGARARAHGLRCKGSSSGGPAGLHAHGWHGHGHGHGSPHHHYHGIPVSNVHGHAYVDKAVVAACGVGRTRSIVGVNAFGKPTRSARSKAVFMALEAEVEGKLSQLEALQHENTTLTQRVEILEVTVARQSAVLDLMTIAITAERAAAAAINSAPRAALAHSLVGGEATIQQPRPLPGVHTGAENTAPVAAEKVPVAAPGSPAGSGLAAMNPDLLEWARRCTLETYVAWYKEHLQEVSMTLLALEDSSPDPEMESQLVQLVASAWLRTSLVCIFQPLTQLRLKGLNLETGKYSEPPEQHWLNVIKLMTVGPQQVAEMENLFHSYNLLHDSFRAELQDTQRELTEILETHDSHGHQHCTQQGLVVVIQQNALLKRVRSILQKTHLLYSSTIGVAAMRILKPKEFAKCSVQSYPYYPCGPSLMRACTQLRSMKAIWGPTASGCYC
ncbi:hypothetical protein Vafri_9171 [Volvox africanus]|uniref:Uncharacterized protein n=1 Tax=Volvox africanus TaxID=51714 RepID=A0A8J4EYT6_9CHLO|nr:hypothetical protein Vafri_9171 [Volvox africanus]